MLHPIVHNDDILRAISMKNTQGQTPFEAYQAKGPSSGNANDLDNDITNVITKIDMALSKHDFTSVKQESLKLRARIEQLARILVLAMNGYLGRFEYTNLKRNTVTYQSFSHSKHYNDHVVWQELIKHIASVPGIRQESLAVLNKHTEPPIDLCNEHEFTISADSSTTSAHEIILRHPLHGFEVLIRDKHSPTSSGASKDCGRYNVYRWYKTQKDQPGSWHHQSTVCRIALKDNSSMQASLKKYTQVNAADQSFWLTRKAFYQNNKGINLTTHIHSINGHYIQFLSQLMPALSYLYDLERYGLVETDIKGENLTIDDQHNVHIIDKEPHTSSALSTVPFPSTYTISVPGWMDHRAPAYSSYPVYAFLNILQNISYAKPANTLSSVLSAWQSLSGSANTTVIDYTKVSDWHESYAGTRYAKPPTLNEEAYTIHELTTRLSLDPKDILNHIQETRKEDKNHIINMLKDVKKSSWSTKQRSIQKITRFIKQKKALIYNLQKFTRLYPENEHWIFRLFFRLYRWLFLRPKQTRTHTTACMHQLFKHAPLTTLELLQQHCSPKAIRMLRREIQSLKAVLPQNHRHRQKANSLIEKLTTTCHEGQHGSTCSDTFAIFCRKHKDAIMGKTT